MKSWTIEHIECGTAEVRNCPKYLVVTTRQPCYLSGQKSNKKEATVLHWAMDEQFKPELSKIRETSLVIILWIAFRITLTWLLYFCFFTVRYQFLNTKNRKPGFFKYKYPSRVRLSTPTGRGVALGPPVNKTLSWCRRTDAVALTSPDCHLKNNKYSRPTVYVNIIQNVNNQCYWYKL